MGLPGLTDMEKFIYAPIIENLVICEMRLRDLDRRLGADPDQYKQLAAMCSNTATRVNRLRTQVLAKIKELSANIEDQPVSITEALMDPDFSE